VFKIILVETEICDNGYKMFWVHYRHHLLGNILHSYDNNSMDSYDKQVEAQLEFEEIINPGGILHYNYYPDESEENPDDFEEYNSHDGMSDSEEADFEEEENF